MSDDAVFFQDLISQGCGWSLGEGRLFLCRENGTTWDNVLIYQMIHFPEREVPEGESAASVITKLWIEPEDWKPLGIAPNCEPCEGSEMFGTVASITRFKGFDEETKNRLWKVLVERCSGKTHRQAMAETMEES